MPQFNVTLKNENASDADVEAAKKQVEAKGGKIVSTFQLIKGFTVSVPDDYVSTLQSDDKLEVEADGEVRTQ